MLSNDGKNDFIYDIFIISISDVNSLSFCDFYKNNEYVENAMRLRTNFIVQPQQSLIFIINDFKFLLPRLILYLYPKYHLFEVLGLKCQEFEQY